jgi:hypothetical protein
MVHPMNVSGAFNLRKILGGRIYSLLQIFIRGLKGRRPIESLRNGWVPDPLRIALERG